MKNVIRTFVVVLALTGVAASAHLSSVVQSKPAQLTATKASAFPVPTCPPDDPNGCGMGTIVSAH